MGGRATAGEIRVERDRASGAGWGSRGSSGVLRCAQNDGKDLIAETDGKDKLVAALKASFDFCGTALANLDDSNLGAPLVLFGNRPSSRGAALVALSDGWNDHYGAQATYLRLNGILPPTAQPQPAKQ